MRLIALAGAVCAALVGGSGCAGLSKQFFALARPGDHAQPPVAGQVHSAHVRQRELARRNRLAAGTPDSGGCVTPIEDEHLAGRAVTAPAASPAAGPIDTIVITPAPLVRVVPTTSPNPQPVEVPSAESLVLISPNGTEPHPGGILRASTRWTEAPGTADSSTATAPPLPRRVTPVRLPRVVKDSVPPELTLPQRPIPAYPSTPVGG